MSNFDIEAYRLELLQKWIEAGASEIRKSLSKRRCGDCEFWMKSSLCPREHNVNGYSRGPSSDDFPCKEFKSNWRRSIVEEAEVVIKMRDR